MHPRKFIFGTFRGYTQLRFRSLGLGAVLWPANRHEFCSWSTTWLRTLEVGFAFWLLFDAFEMCQEWCINEGTVGIEIMSVFSIPCACCITDRHACSRENKCDGDVEGQHTYVPASQLSWTTLQKEVKESSNVPWVRLGAFIHLDGGWLVDGFPIQANLRST